MTDDSLAQPDEAAAAGEDKFQEHNNSEAVEVRELPISISPLLSTGEDFKQDNDLSKRWSLTDGSLPLSQEAIAPAEDDYQEHNGSEAVQVEEERQPLIQKAR